MKKPTGLTTEQRAALLDILACIQRVWDAGDRADSLFGRDVSTVGEDVWELAAFCDQPPAASDQQLIDAFFGGDDDE